jgi:hypothetical protein
MRYLCGPPISDDDLQVLADVRSLSPAVLAADMKSLRSVFAVIERFIDPERFPWVAEKRLPTESEVSAALLASSVLLAAQRISTTRRNTGKAEQEGLVGDYLMTRGFRRVAPTPVTTIVGGPREREFCGECKVGERKADLVVRLHDTRLMAIECKVSNSAVNSVKRINNDAAAKAESWLRQFGTKQLVPVAVISGVFKAANLLQAQDAGLTIIWAHNLEALGAFIESTGRQQ